jgi:hypothetical protein
MRTEQQKIKRKDNSDKRRNAFWKLLQARCVVCKESDPLLIDFHHVGPKKFRIAHLLSRSVYAPLGNWPTLLAAELKQCVPLCVVCHRRLHGKILVLTGEQERDRVDVEEGEIRRILCEQENHNK